MKISLEMNLGALDQIDLITLAGDVDLALDKDGPNDGAIFNREGDEIGTWYIDDE